MAGKHLSKPKLHFCLLFLPLNHGPLEKLEACQYHLTYLLSLLQYLSGTPSFSQTSVILRQN